VNKRKWDRHKLKDSTTLQNAMVPYIMMKSQILTTLIRKCGAIFDTTWGEAFLHTEWSITFPFLTDVTLGIEPPRRVNVTEGVNQTVQYCVLITVPDTAIAINRTDFFVCVSTMDGTAIGEGITCMSLVSLYSSNQYYSWCVMSGRCPLLYSW